MWFCCITSYNKHYLLIPTRVSILELDVCIYLMSAIGIKMEVEEGASATVSELILSLVDEEELNLPRQTTTTTNPVSNSANNTGTANNGGGTVIPLGEIFTLWMTSPLLDVQLKPHHKVSDSLFDPWLHYDDPSSYQ